VLKERNLWTSVNVNFTQNAFTQFISVDSSGRRTYQTVNVDGVYNINLYSDYGFKLGDTKWRFGFGPQIDAYRNIDFVQDKASLNTVKNVTDTRKYGIRVGISQYVNDKYNFYIGPTFAWSQSKASVNSFANAKYWQLDGYAGGSYTIPGKIKMELGTELNFQMRQKDPKFTQNNNFTTWNAYVMKRLFKDEWELRFSVNDILNQNKGYQRNFNSSSFTETYYNTLKRFFLLSLAWNFSKNGKPASF
jgi:hypothetical protein